MLSLLVILVGCFFSSVSTFSLEVCGELKLFSMQLYNENNTSLNEPVLSTLWGASFHTFF